jgi:DNA-binding response OmpR family regulator
MPPTQILLIESSRSSSPSFASSLARKGYQLSIHHKIGSALQALDRVKPDLVVLDAASLQTSGSRMCRVLRSVGNGIPIILLAPAGSRSQSSDGASVTLVPPFTPRKLLNRVARLLPGDARYALEAGPIRLDLAQRRVRAFGRETRLTPKQTRLLEAFLNNPGRLMTRAGLIRQVWHTDYTGDTRTLDVHMSWLRRAIEPDPRRPRFLRTIRGMGYRFDLPGN